MKTLNCSFLLQEITRKLRYMNKSNEALKQESLVCERSSEPWPGMLHARIWLFLTCTKATVMEHQTRRGETLKNGCEPP